MDRVGDLKRQHCAACEASFDKLPLTLRQPSRNRARHLRENYAGRTASRVYPDATEQKNARGGPQSIMDHADEVAEARIWAGFHYRFSTRVGQDMGRQIGEYVAKNVMQPAP